MGKNSKIEWTEHTNNLWEGCTNVHRGCDNCYAEVRANRYGNDLWGNDRPRRYNKAGWSKLKGWQYAAEARGEMHRVFVGSLMDIFEKPMPVVDNNGKPMIHIWDAHVDERPMKTKDLRDDFFNRVVPSCPNLMFLLLTKRPSNINKMVPKSWLNEQPSNVMYGASVVDQQSAKDVARAFAKVNGNKFLSIEPLLEGISMEPFMSHRYNQQDRTEPPIDEWDMDVQWVIVGGESGPNRRPFDPEWARSIKHDCDATGTPFFMKQWDKVKDVPTDLMVRQFPMCHELQEA